MENNKIKYVAISNPSNNEVSLTYAVSIDLSSEFDREHLGWKWLRNKEEGKPYPRTDEVVQSGVAKYRDSVIPKHVHEDLASGKCEKLILNYVTEGYHDLDWDYVSTIFGVEKSKIIWITSVWNPTSLDSQSEVTVLFGNFWEHFVWRLMESAWNPKTKLFEESHVAVGYKQQIQDIKDLKIRKYHGLNYNRIPHIHRAFILAKLKQEELLGRTAYSWGGEENSHEVWDDERLGRFWNYGFDKGFLLQEDHISFIEILKSKPITFPNEELKTNKADSINFDHISTAYFQIVNETHVENSSDCPYLSEKSYKSFASGMPFVMWGNAFTLKALSEKGYDCYHHWINQSYDEIVDDGERLEALMIEIKRLYAIPPEQWSIMLKEMLPVIEHNHLRLNKNCQVAYNILSNVIPC